MKRTIYFSLMFIVSMMSAIYTQAQTWNFAAMSSDDKNLLDADATNWTYDSEGERWKNQKEINGSLIANGQELNYAKGLTFVATAADQIRVAAKRLAMNNSKVTFTIPNVAAGKEVTIKWANSDTKKGSERALYATNLTDVSGTALGAKVTGSAGSQTTTASVTATGDVTFSFTDGALYIYSLVVGDPGSGDSGSGASVAYGVSVNPDKAQLMIGMTNRDMSFFNIDELDKVNIKDGKIAVTSKGGKVDNMSTAAVQKITYAQANEQSLPAGTFTNGSGIQIIDARGWQESAFITFKKFDGAKTYNVYVNGTKIDRELIRDYDSYVRADALGLAKGTYSVKVVGVDEQGVEIAGSENTATDIAVVNYDRRGYAHFGDYGSGVGAYKDDGTLKDNAKVLYVTSNNFNTVKLTLATNDKGDKTEEFTGLGLIFKALHGGYPHDPICVRFIGFIDRNKMDAAQLLSDQGSLLLKSNKENASFNVTIEGVGNDCWMNSGLGVISGQNVEIRNIGIGGHTKAKDCIEIKETKHVWVHNMDMFYAEKGGGDQVKGDGTIDEKDGCSYATFSYNHYWDCGKANLCGMKKETESNLISFHHNWFDHSDSRHPRVRTSTVHVFNNYYDGCSKYGIGATLGCSIFSESNFFRGTKYPMLISKQGRDAEGSGTFSDENGGIIKSFGNIMVERSNNFACYTQKTAGYESNFDCYEVSSRDEKVPSSVVTVAGGTSYNNFDTDPSKIYTYKADDASLVPGIVKGIYGAGRMQHGDITFKFNNTLDDEDYEWNDALWSVISSYKSKLVGIVGEDALNPGGGGDEPGGDTPAPEGTILATFDGTPSQSMFTVAGDYGDGKATYQGTYAKKGVKLNSKGSITFTPQKNYNMTIVLGTAKNGRTVKLNDSETTVGGTENTTDKYYEMGAIAITSGTQYVITQGDKEGLVMFVKLEPVE